MAKHYKYVNGKRLIVVNNYELGSDVIPEEVNLIPDITQADEGKVLMADENGEPKWTSIPSQLPTISGNNGKVLKVNSGATGVEWDDESTELPSVTSADEGDVLTVNASGEWEATAPSGGGGTVIATFSQDSQTEEWSCNMTGAEIHQAMQSGTVYAMLEDDGYLIPMSTAYYDEEYGFEYSFERLILGVLGGNDNFIYPYARYKIEYSNNNGIYVSGPDYANATYMYPNYVLYTDSATFNVTNDPYTPDTIVLSNYESIEWIPGATSIEYSKSGTGYGGQALVVATFHDNYGIQVGLAIVSDEAGMTKINRYEFNESTMTLTLLDMPE